MSLFRPLVVLAFALTAGCNSRASPPPAHDVISWRRVGSWSGRGNTQTESFTSDTGSLRVQWSATEAPPGTGAFRVTFHSAISGRPLFVAVDHHGGGRDTAFVHEDPHTFYAVVESVNEDWSFTVDEGVAATVNGPGGP